jgi:hypothetical protein
LKFSPNGGYKGWIVPLNYWEWEKTIPPLSLFALKNLLQDAAISRLYVSVTDPMYIRIVFRHWPYEDYKAVPAIWEWLADRADAARESKNKICWLREGF